MEDENTGEESQIHVAARIRPFNSANQQCVHINKDHPIVWLRNSENEEKGFTFDTVLGAEATQSEVFEKVAERIVDGCLDGYNGTILAYGQTNSGKTYTMQGVELTNDQYSDFKGIMPRAVEHLFERLETMRGESRFHYQVQCSFVELYNEQCFDLLAPDQQPRLRFANQTVHLDGVHIFECSEVADILRLIEFGTSNRRKAETLANRQSSRSHSVLIVKVETEWYEQKRDDLLCNLNDEDEVLIRRSARLNLVDLAGAERSACTKDKNRQTIKEAIHINKSLTTLGRVIRALSKRLKHVPYRDSALSQLLADSLGGNSKTAFIVTLHPDKSQFDTTTMSLQFSRALRSIKNNVWVNQKTIPNLNNTNKSTNTVATDILVDSFSRAFAQEPVDLNNSMAFDSIEKHTNDLEAIEKEKKDLMQYLEALSPHFKKSLRISSIRSLRRRAVCRLPTKTTLLDFCDDKEAECSTNLPSNVNTKDNSTTRLPTPHRQLSRSKIPIPSKVTFNVTEKTNDIKENKKLISFDDSHKLTTNEERDENNNVLSFCDDSTDDQTSSIELHDLLAQVDLQNHQAPKTVEVSSQEESVTSFIVRNQEPKTVEVSSQEESVTNFIVHNMPPKGQGQETVVDFNTESPVSNDVQIVEESSQVERKPNRLNDETIVLNDSTSDTSLIDNDPIGETPMRPEMELRRKSKANRKLAFNLARPQRRSTLSLLDREILARAVRAHMNELFKKKASNKTKHEVWEEISKAYTVKCPGQEALDATRARYTWQNLKRRVNRLSGVPESVGSMNHVDRLILTIMNEENRRKTKQDIPKTIRRTTQLERHQQEVEIALKQAEFLQKMISMKMIPEVKGQRVTYRTMTKEEQKNPKIELPFKFKPPNSIVKHIG
ncbi:Kinesin-like protein [Aphelenchoides bicaudatus]|nr:Kinesin-like protein [Aphelenchoides bicaudatus]